MKCKESEYLINDYIDGTINSPEKELLEKHIQECSDCQNTVKAVTTLKEKISALSREISLADDLKAKMWQNISNNVTDVNASSNGHTPTLNWQKDNSTVNEIKQNPLPLKRRRMRYVLSGAAAVILLGITVLLLYNRDWNKTDTSKFTMSTPTYWKINKTAGAPSLKNEAQNVVRTINDIDSFTTGEWVLTDNSSSAEIQAAGIGSIKVEPGTKLKFISSGTDDNRIMLESGTVEAVIYSKPRTFFVETKSATAIDLGCSYTLTVGENGDGVLYVKEGLVSLQAHGRESLVPAGKFCISKEGIGPGTPYSANTSPDLKNALMKFDFQNGGEKSVKIILKNAKKRDAVTLLNLLQRVDEANKARVYGRLTEFVPPPKPYPPDSIPMFNPDELTEWIEKMQTEIRENIQKNMENLHQQLDNMKLNLDMDLKDKNDGKEFKFRWKHRLDDDSEGVYEGNDTLVFDKEKFKKELNEEMENLKTELEEVNKELELNNEEIKKEMQKVKEELKDMKIDIKIDMKALNDEIKQEMKKEMEKNKEEMKKNKEEMKKNKEEMKKYEKEKEKENEENEEKDDSDRDY